MKAAVFDMDGVLFDSERVCRDSWVNVSREYGITDMEQAFSLFIGRNSTDVEEIMRERYGKDFPYDAFRKRASQEFRELFEKEGRPKKRGVLELLTFLKNDGWKIGLASSTARESVIRLLEQAGIRSFFHVIVGGDEIIHSKPEPDIYLIACEKLGTLPHETYAIEDSYNGIRSAYRAGMKAIMVPDLLPATEEMRDLSLEIFPDLIRVKEYFEEEKIG